MKNHLVWASVLVFVFGVFTSSSVWADGTITAAVLNLEQERVDDDLAETLTSVIRNEAQQVENYEVVNKVAINFEDILLVLGCNADSTICLKRVAAELKARMLIFGRISKGSGSFQITLNIFDADTGKMINKLSKTIPDSNDPVVEFQKEIEQFFNKEAPAPKTRLSIGSNVNDARVLIEGTFVGMVPLERKGLPPGRYAVSVEHADYVTWESILEIKPGSDLEIWAPLKQNPAAALAQQTQTQETEVTELQADAKLDQTSIKGVNWAAWSAIGVGGVALLGSGTFVILMNNVENQIQQEADDGTLTEERYEELTKRGESFELTHRVLLGVGVAAVIGGTIWLLVDDGSESSARIDVGTTGTAVQARVRW